MTFLALGSSLGPKLGRELVKISASKYLKTFLVFAFFFSLFFWIYFSVVSLSAADDHFFHFRFAELMREHGFFQSFEDFKSIYFSKMAQGNAYFVYYNFLFYLTIIPFTFITPLYLGIKLYAVCAAALFFTAIYFAARSFSVPYAFVWTVALFSFASSVSLLRLLLSRPYVLAPIVLILLIVALHKRHNLVAALLSFIFLFWYSATFFLPVLVAGLYALFDTVYNGRLSWKPFVAVCTGSVLSLVVVSLVSHGFYAYLHDIIFADVFNHADPLPEGGELYPADLVDYVRNNSILIAALIVALCAELVTYWRLRRGRVTLDDDSQATVRATLLFGGLAFLAGAGVITGRFGDYLLAFLGLYVILAFSRLVSQLRSPDRGIQKAVVVGLCLALLYLAASTSLSLNAYLGTNGAPVQVFEGTGSWLAKNTVPGTVVFILNWSWFPQLYYYSPDSDYVAGLEPRFLYEYNKRLYWLWFNMGAGFVCDQKDCPDLMAERARALQHPAEATAWYKKEGDAIAKSLTGDFHSPYLVSSYQYNALNIVLDHNKHFQKVYGGNRTYYIYKVLP